MTKEVTVHGFKDSEIELIKSTVAKGATDAELNLFLHRCKNMNLDPMKPGQIYFVKYGSAAGTIIVGLDGLRAKAAATGKHSGTQRGVLRDENGKCTAAWCEVYRSDWQKPAREEVSMAEYNKGKAQWQSKPETMLKKVAEAAALRMAFPDELGGAYTSEEISAQREVNQVQIPETKERPEFEAALPEISIPKPSTEIQEVVEMTNPVKKDWSDYKLKTGGKSRQGVPVKLIPAARHEEFINWFESEVQKGKTPQQDVCDDYQGISMFLKQLREAKV